MASSYDGTVALDVATHGKLTDDEMKEMKQAKLYALFSSSSEDGASEEDISDILDYACAMVNNGKSVEYVIKELCGMEMDFCPEETAHQVGAILAEYVAQKNTGGGIGGGGESSQQQDSSSASNGRVVSLKVRARLCVFENIMLFVSRMASSF